MKPRINKKSGDMEVFMNGTAIWYHEKYQLAPAVTKNAPDRNLKISFQLMFFILSDFMFFPLNQLIPDFFWNQVSSVMFTANVPNVNTGEGIQPMWLLRGTAYQRFSFLSKSCGNPACPSSYCWKQESSFIVDLFILPWWIIYSWFSVNLNFIKIAFNSCCNIHILSILNMKMQMRFRGISWISTKPE